MIPLILSGFIPILILLLTFVPLYISVKYWRWRVAKRNRRNPLTKNMLRPAGQTLREAIIDIDSERELLALTIFVTPFFVYSIHLSQSYFGQQPESWFRIGTSMLLTFVAGFFMVRKFLGMADSRRKLVLGLEGEQATGEELNQLMLSGCRVFHDVPSTYGNIDHVVISNSGVFAVETKMVSKPNNGSSEKVTVDHQHGVVRFSEMDWNIPVKQLETNANWLSKHLENAVGRPIKVEAMLAVPGYYIEERIGRGSVYVFSPTSPKRFFVHNRTTHRPEEIQQIAHQVEQLCRNLEPSYGYENKFGKDQPNSSQKPS